ncbi:CPBP family intramembrane glutamic endopeptidase [Deefgea piscis]|uniref:CPBP family intramembrane glutamic endopeptidase n=1 Tax=Deefgea piscis TaxID=2739061 RepID=UPI001C814316|nr:CPBP family intramembrane glutamic endopeptidase [Deefgea piscis]QZA80098.1 CPBP family intramembrane metalloprotease [Deefgea piscis]
MTLLYFLPFAALFAASLLAILGFTCRYYLPLLVLAYGAAALLGLLDAWALLPMVLLGLAGWGMRGTRRSIRLLAHLVFVGTALGLMLHRFAGFKNPLVFAPQALSVDALPFSLYLNLDKPLIGFGLLLCFPLLAQRMGLGRTLVAAIIPLIAAIALIVPVALSWQVLAWQPKWPDITALWLLNNFLLVCMAEEVFFRAYIQGHLSRWLAHRPYGAGIALGLAALLFGLAHMAGGWLWVVLATIAGVAYGVAYRYGGLLAAMLAHFGLNALHFTLLTYPMLR